MAKVSGIILYRGPSRINGQPIVVIMTGMNGRGKNVKTGGLLSTWILCENRNPLSARNHRHDVAICGQCPNRKGGCYVTLYTAPLSIYRAYKRGKYPHYNSLVHDPLISGKTIRFGAYGDPGAVPLNVWDNLAGLSGSVVGYTHLGGTPLGVGLAAYCMGSVESKEGAIKLQNKGFRTFRVVPPSQSSAPLLNNEIKCLALKGVKCEKCKLCGGNSVPGAKSITIPAHGGYFQMAIWNKK